MSHHHGRRQAVAATAGGLLLTLSLGCASVASRAPAVTAAMVAESAAQGVDPAALERGRALYVGRCTRCHGPVAVARHTPQQWREIVPRMAEKTHLTAGEEADVAAYVAAVAAAGPQ